MIFRKIVYIYRQIIQRGFQDFLWRIILSTHAILRWVFRTKPKSISIQLEQERFFFENSFEMGEVITKNIRYGLIKEANRIVSHQITLFNSMNVQYENKIDWHLHPCTKRPYPQRYWWSVNTTGREYGDVRVVWELNRHQHLVTLGKAFCLTRNRGYYEEFSSQIEDWLNENPFEIGINWTNTLEVAMRAINWLWCYFLFKTELHRNGLGKRLLRSLYVHGEYIHRYLSEYLHPTNHIVGEAAALYLLSNAISYLDQSGSWKAKSKRILEREMDRQVYSDGCHKEQAFSYHRFVVDLFLQVYILGLKVNNGFSRQFADKLGKMIEFMMYTLDSDGSIFMIGDSDSSRGFPMSHSQDFWKAEDILCIGAVLFRRSDFKYAATESAESVIWLLGRDGYSKFKAMRATRPTTLSCEFKDAGYYVMRNGWGKSMCLVFDAGAHGIGTMCGHGHADHLSIVLSVNGKKFLVDPGTYTYDSSNRLRNYLRSTLAHNTVTIDGQSQPEPIGNFDWSNLGRSKLLNWNATHDYDIVEASYRYYQSCIHQRKVVFKKTRTRETVITDTVYGKGLHQVSIRFHLSPLVQIEDTTDNSMILKMGNVYLFLGHYGVNAVFNVSDDVVSYNYGEYVNSKTIDLTAMLELPVKVITVIRQITGTTQLRSINKEIRTAIKRIQSS